MKFRMALCIVAFLAACAPAAAEDLTGLAPADEYFGRFDLSILGIANTIRDSGARIDAGGDVRAMIDGPLSFATDALRDWEHKYPADPWIAKDLLALETVYLRVANDDGARLAAQTDTWLTADYPNSAYAAQARGALAGAPVQSPVAARTAIVPSYSTPWERFGALRAPLPPQ